MFFLFGKYGEGVTLAFSRYLDFRGASIDTSGQDQAIKKIAQQTIILPSPSMASDYARNKIIYLKAVIEAFGAVTIDIETEVRRSTEYVKRRSNIFVRDQAIVMMEPGAKENFLLTVPELLEDTKVIQSTLLQSEKLKGDHSYSLLTVEDAYFEGGNTFYLPEDKIIFHGLNPLGFYRGQIPVNSTNVALSERLQEKIEIFPLSMNENVNFSDQGNIYYHLDCFMQVLPDGMIILLNKDMLSNESYGKLVEFFGARVIDLGYNYQKRKPILNFVSIIDPLDQKINIIAPNWPNSLVKRINFLGYRVIMGSMLDNKSSLYSRGLTDKVAPHLPGGISNFDQGDFVYGHAGPHCLTLDICGSNLDRSFELQKLQDRFCLEDLKSLNLYQIRALITNRELHLEDVQDLNAIQISALLAGVPRGFFKEITNYFQLKAYQSNPMISLDILQEIRNAYQLKAYQSNPRISLDILKCVENIFQVNALQIPEVDPLVALQINSDEECMLLERFPELGIEIKKLEMDYQIEAYKACKNIELASKITTEPALTIVKAGGGSEELSMPIFNFYKSFNEIGWNCLEAMKHGLTIREVEEHSKGFTCKFDYQTIVSKTTA